MDELKTGNQYKGIRFVGVVVNNNDPMRLERVTVRVPEIFDGTEDAHLPWAIPGTLRLLGTGGGAHQCYIPVVGSLVYVEFQNGDPQFPIYVGSPIVASARNAVFNTNYPKRYGWADPKGNVLYHDLQTGDVDYHHFSGTTIHITPAGLVSVTGVSDITLTSPTKIDLTAPTVNVNTTNTNINASDKLEITSPITHASGTVADHDSTMDTMRDIYNGHTHSDPQGGSVSPPGSTM